MTTTENRRAQILRISTRLFSENGYARTTLDDVAAEIGFTKPAIYHWFESKDEILFEIHRDIVEPALDEVRHIRASGGTPTEQLRRILAAHVARVLHNADANTVFGRESAQLTSERGEAIGKLDRAYEHEVRAVYAAGVAAGEFVDIDPVVAIGTLLSACSWVSQWYRPEGPLTAKAISQMIGTLLETGYRGGKS